MTSVLICVDLFPWTFDDLRLRDAVASQFLSSIGPALYLSSHDKRRKLGINNLALSKSVCLSRSELCSGPVKLRGLQLLMITHKDELS